MIEATVNEIPSSEYCVSPFKRGHEITGDEPEPHGNNPGPTPFDLLLAAIVETTAMTVRCYTKNEGLPLERVSVHAIHEKDSLEVVFSKAVTLTGDSLSEGDRQQLLTIAGECPVSRTLTGG